ncbi:death-associated inhibitor of apoptosis 1-like [Anopheles coustani]|uniref:death-associated inhibitor of apoptosis 1-like n=1 Tax=Anopheles coustani TaxID=139045 RepID=UPI0026589775|nr:death-associated inhibitor of apoptosis 1-like [Anopheles coustani]
MLGTPVPIEPVHHHHQSGSSNGGLNEESKRLETYSRWPKPLIIMPAILARFGFYYTGARDIVKCYFCLVELGSWERTDDAAREHLRWSRHCPLMTRRQTNNVPLDANFLNDVPQPAFDTVGVRSQQVSPAQQAAEEPIAPRSLRLTDAVPVAEYNRQVLAKEVQAPKVRAKYPSYVQLEQRLKTFNDWPIALPQKPEQLVEAGFFYTGKSDQVACFSCGGQLKGWVPGDDPWEEHAKYYEDCHYLRLMKTRAFIDNCKTQTTQQMAEPSKLTFRKDNLRRSTEPSEDEKRTEPAESKLCKVCYENEYNTVFMPCGHVVACGRCAASVQRCPLCNEPFTNVFRVRERLLTGHGMQPATADNFAEYLLHSPEAWERAAEAANDAAREHLRWSRHCPLMTRRQTNNVPLDENFLNDVPQPVFDTVGVRSQKVSPAQQAAGEPIAPGSLRLTDAVSAAAYNRQALAKEVEKFKERAKCPSYAEFEQRLKTFDDWPIALPQIPEQLVEAGFVYTGESDQVACFSCGGQLKGWIPDDDPWEEHAKYYEDCHYLRLMKTRTFIENCKAKKTQQVAEPSELTVGKDNVRESSEASEDEKRSEPVESKLCKVCYENEYNTAFMPCGHVVACRGCAASAQSCLLCNEPFINVFRLHIV